MGLGLQQREILLPWSEAWWASDGLRGADPALGHLRQAWAEVGRLGADGPHPDIPPALRPTPDDGDAGVA